MNGWTYVVMAITGWIALLGAEYIEFESHLIQAGWFVTLVGGWIGVTLGFLEWQHGREDKKLKGVLK